MSVTQSTTAGNYFRDSGIELKYYTDAQGGVLLSLGNAWSNIEIVRSIESLSNSFTLELEMSSIQELLGSVEIIKEGVARVLTENTSTVNEVIFAIEAAAGRVVNVLPAVGSEITIFYRGSVALRGFIDSSSFAVAAGGEVKLTMNGRSKTATLVDSSCRIAGKVLDSADLGITSHPAEFRNKKVEDIASVICAPFGIQVRALADTGAPIDKLIIEPGDTVQSILDDLATKRALLLYSDADGNVILNKISPMSPKILGDEQNGIKSFRITSAQGNSYAFYHVVGNKPGLIGTAADFSWKIEASPRTWVRTENSSDPETLQRRAEFERDTRWGNSRKIEVTVAGWRRRDGTTYSVGDYILLQNLDSNPYVITQIENKYDLDGGHETVLQLVRPEALQVLGEADKRRYARGALLRSDSSIDEDNPTLVRIRAAIEKMVQAVKKGIAPLTETGAPKSSRTADCGKNASKEHDAACKGKPRW